MNHSGLDAGPALCRCGALMVRAVAAVFNHERESMTGTIIRIHEKGYGFIQPNDGGPESVF